MAPASSFADAVSPAIDGSGAVSPAPGPGSCAAAFFSSAKICSNRFLHSKLCGFGVSSEQKDAGHPGVAPCLICRCDVHRPWLGPDRIRRARDHSRWPSKLPRHTFDLQQDLLLPPLRPEAVDKNCPTSSDALIRPDEVLTTQGFAQPDSHSGLLVELPPFEGFYDLALELPASKPRSLGRLAGLHQTG